MQARERYMRSPVAQGTQRAFHRGMAEHGIQTLTNGREDHALRSDFRASAWNAFADLSQHRRGGITRHNRNGNDPASCGLDFFATDDLVAGPVAALDENVRQKARDDLPRRGLIEN